jgi:hypothetical protein
MIVTPDFVYINNPRTGTTFARKAIAAAYSAEARGRAQADPRVRELFLPIERGVGQIGIDHHGTVAQIPAEYRRLPIVSALRNPFTLLVAVFELGLWRREAWATDQAGELGLPDSESLQCFLRTQELAMARRWGLPFGKRPGFGPLSMHHLQMFTAKPEAAFRLVKDGATDESIEAQFPPIEFLRQERLREDLCRYLDRSNTQVSLDAVRTHPPSHVTKRSQNWSHESFDEPTIEHILNREAFLFRSLARRGVDYTFANADFDQPVRDSAKRQGDDGSSASRTVSDSFP